jgi:hypothetical protein
VLLPNPLVYVHKERWLQSQREWAFPVGHIHGDLHTGNVICGVSEDEQNEGIDPKVDQNYQIIDFSEYRKDGIPFFDLAYLEFDIIRQVLPLATYEGKVSWWYVLTSIMREVIPPYQLVRDEQAQYAEQLIQPIRYHVNTLINRADDRTRKGFKLAWWMAVYSVGLNYARKRDAERKPQERTAALLYAAFGLQHVLHLLDIPYKHRATAPATIAWIQENDFLVSIAPR